MFNMKAKKIRATNFYPIRPQDLDGAIRGLDVSDAKDVESWHEQFDFYATVKDKIVKKDNNAAWHLSRILKN